MRRDEFHMVASILGLFLILALGFAIQAFISARDAAYRSCVASINSALEKRIGSPVFRERLRHIEVGQKLGVRQTRLLFVGLGDAGNLDCGNFKEAVRGKDKNGDDFELVVEALKGGYRIRITELER